MISGQCAFCGGAKAFDFKRYCCDWCKAEQAAANDAPPLAGDWSDLTQDEVRALWGVVGFRRKKGAPKVVAVRWAARRFGVDEVRLWVLLDKWGGYARAEIERVG
jgi:hypothetical protein